MDSTKLPVCDNLRIYKHKTFQSIVQICKSSTGWFLNRPLLKLVNVVQNYKCQRSN
ncbi:transposase [Orientia tsutsugamushi]|uniref:transposase n=1 Tax=Orientia tsutsugamushi TaxID=784 RepID=UPI0009B5AFD0